MVRIAVTGYKGRLGSALIKHGCLPFEADITNSSQIEKELFNLNPKVVINCAAKTDVDVCEDDIINTYRVNTFGVQNLIRGFTGKFVQISTDYIFNGEVGNYSENSIASPINSYGFSKHFAEVVLRNTNNHLIIRTTVLYGGNNNRKSDFPTSIYNKISNGIPVSCSEINGNPTYSDHLAIGILDAIEKNCSGILNISGIDNVSRYEVGIRMCDLFSLDRSLIQHGDAFGIAKRPKKAGFNLDKAKSLGIPLRTLEDGLKEWHKNKYGDHD